MKEKITTGANDRPKHETIAQTGEGLPDDSGPIIEVGRDGTAKMRENSDQGPARPDPQTGPAVADEDPDYSPMDRSPARQKDHARAGRAEPDKKATGIDEIDGAGPNEDTYD